MCLRGQGAAHPCALVFCAGHQQVSRAHPHLLSAVFAFSLCFPLCIGGAGRAVHRFYLDILPDAIVLLCCCPVRCCVAVHPGPLRKCCRVPFCEGPFRGCKLCTCPERCAPRVHHAPVPTFSSFCRSAHRGCPGGLGPLCRRAAARGSCSVALPTAVSCGGVRSAIRSAPHTCVGQPPVPRLIAVAASPPVSPFSWIGRVRAVVRSTCVFSRRLPQLLSSGPPHIPPAHERLGHSDISHCPGKLAALGIFSALLVHQGTVPCCCVDGSEGPSAAFDSTVGAPLIADPSCVLQTRLSRTCAPPVMF